MKAFMVLLLTVGCSSVVPAPTPEPIPPSEAPKGKTPVTASEVQAAQAAALARLADRIAALEDGGVVVEEPVEAVVDAGPPYVAPTDAGVEIRVDCIGSLIGPDWCPGPINPAQDTIPAPYGYCTTLAASAFNCGACDSPCTWPNNCTDGVCVTCTPTDAGVCAETGQ